MLFLVLLAIMLQVRPLYLLYGERYQKTVSGWEIYYSIFKSKQKKKAKKILLGDSVGNQLFPNNKHTDTVNSLACNQSIAMVGQFILLNNYLNAGNEVDTVFMLFSPFTFQNNLNQVYTYHYFIKPFYTDEYRPQFSETVNTQIDKVPFKGFAHFPLILTSDWTPDFTPKDKMDYSFLSPISIEYLHKIQELGVKHHFKLIIMPPPASMSKKPLIEKMDQSEIAKNGLTQEFAGYFSNIVYYDDHDFFDGTHVKKPENFREFYTEKYNLMK